MNIKPISTSLIITQFNGKNVSFSFDLNYSRNLMVLLNSFNETIYNHPFHKVYYLIDKLLTQLENNHLIERDFSNHVSAMINSNRGENFIFKTLGKDLNNEEYDDIIRKPLDIVIVNRY